MITEFKSEFSRIAGIVGADFQPLDFDELQMFVQGYDFASMPLINFVPIERFTSTIGPQTGQLIWTGECVLQFLTLARVNETEDEKDARIDSMINLSSNFFRELRKNTERVFGNPEFTMRSNILRFKTANYCVGVETTIGFITSCNRI
jgi:hypothetical protein